MSRETERLKAEARARREEVQQTFGELGERVDEGRVFFYTGAAAGAIGLWLINRIFLRRIRKILRWGRCSCK